ncbi:signaling lymphocytic activation molecule-like [Pristis pectinata]|uniref:signaling lymphocytic activation molecule-like n=1 Tax=Pristis pectinata TaxID=685728 RepID=UPI00223E34B7|nr:signaling lymphocytic activation molecule-like [Pristis pectinata]
MGTRMDPSYTCLFVGYAGQSMFQACTGNAPQLFLRYIDDCIGAASCTHTELIKFINFASNFQPVLEFTCSLKGDTSTGAVTSVCIREGPVIFEEPMSGTHITVQNITGTCNLTLTCSVTSGDPTSFRWWRGGEAVGNDSPHHLWEHGETVEIHHTAEVEDVVYRCEARNPISEGTAQIRLWDVCKVHTTAPNTTTTSDTTPPMFQLTTLLIVLAVLVIFLISALIVIPLVIWRRRAARREMAAERDMSSGTEGPAETSTVYADLRWTQNHHASQHPPVGNKRCVSLEVSAENPSTEYAAVVYRAKPFPGRAEDRAHGQRPAV